MKCRYCGLNKSIEQMRRDKSYPDGVRPQCRDCHNAYKRTKWPDYKHKHPRYVKSKPELSVEDIKSRLREIMK